VLENVKEQNGHSTYQIENDATMMMMLMSGDLRKWSIVLNVTSITE